LDFNKGNLNLDKFRFSIKVPAALNSDNITASVSQLSVCFPSAGVRGSSAPLKHNFNSTLMTLYG